MIKYILFLAVITLILPIIVFANRSVNLKPGDIPPDFTGESVIGKISLSQFKGQYVILYFYPKDMSPGCTMQANEFRKLYNELQKQKVEVIGISKDNLESHDAFAKKYNIPYPLISDNKGKLSNLYGARRGIMRSTFLIGPDHKIINVIHTINPIGHATELSKLVESIK